MADPDRLAPLIKRLELYGPNGLVPVTVELMTDVIGYLRELEDYRMRAQIAARIDAQLINHFRDRVRELDDDCARLNCLDRYRRPLEVHGGAVDGDVGYAWCVAAHAKEATDVRAALDGVLAAEKREKA